MSTRNVFVVLERTLEAVDIRHAHKSPPSTLRDVFNLLYQLNYNV